MRSFYQQGRLSHLPEQFHISDWPVVCSVVFIAVEKVSNDDTEIWLFIDPFQESEFTNTPWMETHFFFMFSSSICFILFHQRSLFFYFLPLRHHTHSLCSTVFLCPPSQMWEPVIPHRNKMKNNEYESVEHVDSDLTLMFENAKRYNVPHSSIYKRALKLQHIQQVSLSACTSYLWCFQEAL